MYILGSYKDNSYINFLLYSLKDHYILAYKRDENVKKLFRRVGLLNFFKHTIPLSSVKNKPLTKINMRLESQNNDEILIDTNYFQYFYKKNILKKSKNLIMPYFMYPRIYNSFYKKINILKKPNFNLRIFFSGSIVNEGYKNFIWKKEPEKFPNRLKIIEEIFKEFKNDIFLIKSQKDIKNIESSKKELFFVCTTK